MIHKTKWSIDPNYSEVAFTARHLLFTQLKGRFKKFEASIYTTTEDFTKAEINVQIDASSLTTGNTKCDKHLKSVHFLDVKKHKKITFTSISIRKEDEEGNYILWGRLTLKGVSKNIKLHAQFLGTLYDVFGNEKAGFIISGKINRSDWGLVWNKIVETGGLMVGEEVGISCKVELTSVHEQNQPAEIQRRVNKVG